METVERKDGFVECPHCGSNMCYAQSVGDQETWMCLTCGFSSTTLMKEGTESEKQVSERQPQLYQDLKFTDRDRYVWYPAVITLPEVGMVYLDGTSKEDCRWASVPFRKITFKERKLKKFKGQQYVADMQKIQYFSKDNGFIEAAMSIGMFGDTEKES